MNLVDDIPPRANVIVEDLFISCFPKDPTCSYEGCAFWSMETVWKPFPGVGNNNCGVSTPKLMPNNSCTQTISNNMQESFLRCFTPVTGRINRQVTVNTKRVSGEAFMRWKPYKLFNIFKWFKLPDPGPRICLGTMRDGLHTKPLVAKFSRKGTRGWKPPTV